MSILLNEHHHQVDSKMDSGVLQVFALLVSIMRALPRSMPLAWEDARGPSRVLVIVDVLCSGDAKASRRVLRHWRIGTRCGGRGITPCSAVKIR